MEYYVQWSNDLTVLEYTILTINVKLSLSVLC